MLEHLEKYEIQATKYLDGNYMENTKMGTSF